MFNSLIYWTAEANRRVGKTTSVFCQQDFSSKVYIVVATSSTCMVWRVTFWVRVSEQISEESSRCNAVERGYNRNTSEGYNFP